MSNSNYGRLSKWYNADSMSAFYKVLKVGDLIEFDRGLYNHWAVCIKVNGSRTKVIHRTASASTPFALFASVDLQAGNGGIGQICESELVAVLGYDSDYKLRINNSLDNTYEPDEPDVIVKRAFKYLLNEYLVGEFSVAGNNCEHFVTLCRYNVKRSTQVDTAVKVARIAVTGIALIQAISELAKESNEPSTSTKRGVEYHK
ncbi:hypothetical protein CHUAL_003514 [Chamberlinius hualienensis]